MMNTSEYKNFLNYLDELEEHRIKTGLERVNRALDVLGHPEHHFKSIHIAGTNGKGSTAAFLESILRNSGYKVALYTSPHLIDVRERIQINREWISKDEVVELYTHLRDKNVVGREYPLSYFELLTVMAFVWFSRQGVDFAVIETGLGGRLDATNVVQPLLVIITPVSTDHSHILGDDLASIAREKSGIIKAGVFVVSAMQQIDVERIFVDTCRRLNCPLKFVRAKDGLKLSLAGRHQVINASLALAASDELKSLGYNIQGTEESLGRVNWPGRIQIVSGDPEIVLDGAHNPDGCRVFAEYLSESYRGREIVFIFGAMKDKDMVQMVSYLRGGASAWVIFPLDGERAATCNEIREIVSGERVETAYCVDDAIGKATRFGFKNPLIAVTGSLYLVGKFLKRMDINAAEA